MIIAVIGQKGGTGKTTVSVHLSGWRTLSDREAILIDADRQQTSLNWVDRRNELGFKAPLCVQQLGRSLKLAAVELSRKYSDVIVDVGAGDELAFEAILRVADFAVLPLQPNEFDIWSLSYLQNAALDALALNDQLRVISVLNRAPPHYYGLDARAATDALARCEGIETSGLVVKERGSIRRATPTGRLIHEWRPRDGRAIEELGAVYRHVFGEPVPLDPGAVGSEAR
ncbi:MAG: AAA family ATPase [Chloroflexota bacterium]|nr:AAA family ATPase [Chloroflexota bacterium]